MNLQGNIGEIGITLQVTRKETGKVEEVQLVGFVNEDQLKQMQADGLLTNQSKEQ